MRMYDLVRGRALTIYLERRGRRTSSTCHCFINWNAELGIWSDLLPSCLKSTFMQPCAPDTHCCTVYSLNYISSSWSDAPAEPHLWLRGLYTELHELIVEARTLDGHTGVCVQHIPCEHLSLWMASHMSMNDSYASLLMDGVSGAVLQLLISKNHSTDSDLSEL